MTKKIPCLLNQIMAHPLIPSLKIPTLVQMVVDNNIFFNA